MRRERKGGEKFVIKLSVYGETENCCHIKLKMTAPACQSYTHISIEIEEMGSFIL